MNYTNAIQLQGVVLIEFYASWCPHCQRMMPIVSEIKDLLSGTVPVFQYDIDENQEDASIAGVSSIPTFLIYKNGEEQWRYSGEISAQELLSKIQAFM